MENDKKENPQEKRLQFTADQIKKGREDLGTVLGLFIYPDGSEKKLTMSDLIRLINTAIDEEHPDAEATEKLQIVLESILNYAATLPDLEKSPVAATIFKNLRIIYDYLRQGIVEEDLEKFLKEQRPFMAIPRPAGIEDFLKINDGNTGGDQIIKTFNNTTVTFSGRLSIDEQKIAELVRLSFLSMNPYKATKGINTLVEIPLTATMEVLKRTVNANNKKMFVRQLTKNILPTIAHAHIEIRKTDGKDVDEARMEIGGGFFRIKTRDDKIYFRISPEYAAYLNSGALSQYSRKTLSLGDRRNPLPYYLAVKLQDHYFHDGNRIRKTNNILSVKKILEFCADNIPSYAFIQETDPGHWIRRIREPLEAALNEIQQAGLFEWEYCKKGMAEASEQEKNTRSYRKWSSLYITFALIPDEPDQTARLEHKQERIEEAQSKKAVKDAEKIIKADQIQRKKGRKSTKKE